jgi:hypothetical protein
MATPIFYNRVLETSTTTGTGTLTLAGAVAGYQSWAAIGDGLTSYYYLEAVDANGIPTGDWEVGLGTYAAAGTTLARTTVLKSSNSNNAVSLSAGTKRVGNSVPAALLSGLYAGSRSALIGGVLDDATNTTISCSTVTAFIESLGYAITASPSNLTITVGASVVGHVYLKSDGTLADSTTAPVAFATPAGTARSKSGDTTQRYLGSFVTNGSSQILPFTMIVAGPNLAHMHYTNAGTGGAPYRFLSGGTATSYGAVTSLATLAPANVVTQARILIVGTGQVSPNAFTIYLSTDGTHGNAAEWGQVASSGNPGAITWVPLETSTPGIYYKTTDVGALAYLDIFGYEFVR